MASVQYCELRHTSDANLKLIIFVGEEGSGGAGEGGEDIEGC